MYKKKNKLWDINISLRDFNKDKDINEYFDTCKKKLGMIPNIIKVNSIDKKKFEAFNNFYKKLMQDENYLSQIEKEMIAVVVSSINRCLYCCISHSYNLSKLLNNKALSKKILINYRSAELSSKHKAMLDFTRKLTELSSSIDKNDRDLLRKKKFSENHILEIVEVTSFFNMTNRIASGTNLMPNEEYFA